MKAKKVTKTALGVTMAAALVASSLVIPATTEEAEAATDFSFTAPSTSMSVYQVEDKTVMTTLTQRAASEIPLIFGINVKGGNAFNGLLMLAGTDVNENPDPYIWNFNYALGQNGQSVGSTSLSDTSVYTSLGLTTGVDGDTYSNIGNKLTNPNGLYQSGGANQTYGDAVDELGGVGYALGWRTDVVFSFSSTFVDQIDTIHGWAEAYAEDPDSAPYYREGDEDYYPLLTDVQTAGVSARLYSWTDNGQALSAYLDEHEDLTTRYDDPEIIGQDVAQFSAGIPYYIASLIKDGTIEKKTAAYVNSISDNTLTVVDPGTVGSVYADVYAEVCNFDYVEDGQYTLEELMESYPDIDIIILGATGYSYASASGNSETTTDRLAVETELCDLGYTEEMPMVMDRNSIGVTIGNNGYNFAPTTPLFMPYAQVYAYMDELEAAMEKGLVDESINPVAMAMFMFDEFAHVTDESVEDVTLYYIGSNWDAVSEYDQVPDLENYVYDKQAIIAAIQVGIEYAQSDAAETNGNYLLPAYSANETAYILLTETATTEEPDAETMATHDIITINVPDDDGNTVLKYLDLTALVASDDEDSGTSSGDSGEYANVRTSYEAIVDYYTEGDYGYGDDLATTLQNYADHMINHVWVPDTEVEGTYRTVLADYSVVEEAIALADALDDSAYVDLSGVEAAIAAVDYTKLVSEQDEVDEMAQAIIDAIAELIGTGDAMTLETVVTYTGLLLQMLDESDYTAESYAALVDAYNDAETLLAGKATQDDMDAALEALMAAVSGLEKAQTVAYSGDTLAIRSGVTFYLYNEIGDDTYTEEFTYGKTDDEILIGDWDGDGTDEICVRRGNIYYVQYELGSNDSDDIYRFTYGRADDEILAGDWDKDGVDELAVRRNGNIFYYQSVLGSDEGVTRATYGRADDEILVGDWDGDGVDTFAVRRSGTTYYFQSELGSDDGVERVADLGLESDTVLVGDWDNDGDDELCIRRGTNILLQETYKDTTLSNTFRMTQATSNNDLFVIKWQ
ncbi:MAG: hypothetical protein LIO75_08805 [Lachnospiraceae bacterium]|nr:hypothetical protein [Lachnospiraceae bacterium]